MRDSSSLSWYYFPEKYDTPYLFQPKTSSTPLCWSTGGTRQSHPTIAWIPEKEYRNAIQIIRNLITLNGDGLPGFVRGLVDGT